MSRAPTQRKLSAPGQVRIVGGAWRGRKLPVPAVDGLRPTPDRVRETVFNWLAPVIDGARCIDVFAGTGAFGFEAASRGAAEVWLVERDARAVAALREAGAKLGGEGISVVVADAIEMLRRPPASMRFDIAFVDPPYAADLAATAIRELMGNGWLAPGALIYAEWPGDKPAPLPGVPWKSARAGQVAYALYRFDPAAG